MEKDNASHFGDKHPLKHVVEKRAAGIVSLAESHGAETPGHISAGADAARETSLILILLWSILPQYMSLHVLITFACGWLLWKTGRSAWLGWTRLERLHRLIEQEKHEIEHNRDEERVELRALYKAKGFEGKLLDDVVDVLMADGDRLLKVMLEEELGLTLEVFEHPLKQCLGAATGTLLAYALCGIGLFFSADKGILIACFATLATATAISSRFEKNRMISAIIWNLSLGVLAFGVAHFVLKILT